jgi:hypothetical protein
VDTGANERRREVRARVLEVRLALKATGHDRIGHDRIADYLRGHAPELDPEHVGAFMVEHAKPDDEPGSHIEWVVRLLRQRGESAIGDGPSVDRVADELRRRDA